MGRRSEGRKDANVHVEEETVLGNQPRRRNRRVDEHADQKQAVPVVKDDILLYQSDGQDCRLTVDAVWYAWLSTATTFAFHSEVGTFGCREQAGHKRGGWGPACLPEARRRSVPTWAQQRR